MKALHSNNSELESFVVSIYVIGFAVGPLLVAPLSELFGRAIVYNVSNVIFLGATIGCALSTNVGMFLAFRLLCGCAGATPLALGGGSISDLMEPERMGTAMAIWGLGSLAPPVRPARVSVDKKRTNRGLFVTAGVLAHCWWVPRPIRGLEMDLLGDCHSSM
jgi:MFS family permease